MSELIRFYYGLDTDRNGRTFNDIISQDDHEFERNHDFIQWIFPLIEQSEAVPDSPVLTSDDIECFRKSRILKKRLKNAFHRFILFLGLEYNGGTVSVRDEGSVYRKVIMRNHNWLRITRVLTSLKLLGKEKESAAFYQYLTTVQREVSPVTFKYWQDTQIENPKT